MSARVNYFRLHIGDFLSGVSHMDGMEIGAYTMLLIAHYQLGEQGLPNDDRRLARYAKLSIKQWARVRDVVLEKFNINGLGNFWTHSRVIDELRQIEMTSSKQRAKILKRWEGDNTAVIPNEYHPIANSQEPEEYPPASQAPTGAATLADEKFSVTSHVQDGSIHRTEPMKSQRIAIPESERPPEPETTAAAAPRAFPDQENPEKNAGNVRRQRKRGERIEAFMACKFPEILPGECPQEWGEAAVTAAVRYRPQTKIDAELEKKIKWHFEKFHSFFASSSKQNAWKLDWRLAWLNWWKSEFEKIAKQEERDELFNQKRASIR